MSSAKISSRPKTVTTLSTFSPSSIAGCVLWLDASDSTKITMSGSNVTQIVDKSSNAYTFTGSAGSYPTRTTTLNGLPVISSAAGQYLQTTSFNQNFLTATSFFVIRGTQDLTVSNLYYMVIHGAVTRVIEIGVYGGANPGTYLNQSGTGFLYSAYMGFNPVNTTLLASSLVTGSVLTNQAYINGSLNYTGGENGTFTQLTSQTLRCIGHPTASTGYDFAEVILYGTVLTTTQRQQVEGYLSQKWGSTSLLPAGHPGLTSLLYGSITTIAPTTITISASFVPTSIAGCGIWLDSSDSASFTFSSGSNISQWRDKSGSSNHFTPSSGTPTYISDAGKSVVNFPSGAIMTSANQITFSSINLSAFFIVSKLTGFGSWGAMLLGFTNVNGGDYSIRFYDYILLGTQAATDVGGSLGAANYYVNGTFNPNFGSNVYLSNYTIIDTVAPGISGTSFLTLSSAFMGRTFVGTIAEFIYYPGGITNNQRLSIEGYLAQKWGLTSNLPSGHTGLTTTLFGTRTVALAKQKVANIPKTLITSGSFLPTSIAGCGIWLDAADSTSFTFSSGSLNVSQWRDKSGSSNHFNLTSGTTRYITDAGKDVVQFLSGGIMSSANQITFTTSSAFFIVSKLTGLGDWATLLAFTNINGSDYSIRLYTYILLGTQAYTDGGGSMGTANYYVNGTFNPNFGSNVYLNNYTIIDTVRPSTSGTSFLTLSTGFMGRVFVGNMAEFIYYPGGVTSNERQTIEGYLAQKWGLTSNLVAGHPGLTTLIFGTQITPVPITSTVTFLPTSITGCQLWLDALDSSTVTGTTTVTQWRDKSGNSRHLGAGSGTTSYSSNAIQVNNSYLYVESPVNLSSFSVFIVAKTTGGNNQTVFSGKPNPANTDEDWDSLDGFGFFMDSQSSVRFYGQFSNVSQFNVNTSTPQVFSFQSSGTSLSSWYNGVSKTGATLSSSRTSTAQGFMVGASWSGSSYYNIVATASVYEAITYNTILTTTQRQQVESYLAQKWSLTSNLPSGHPGLTTSVYQNTVTLTKQKIRVIQPVVIAPLTYYNVSPDNWTSYWLPYLQGLTSVNSTATPTFSTLTGSLSSYNSGYLAVNGNIYLAPASTTYSTPITIIPTVNDGSISSSLVSGTGGATNYGGDFLGGGGLAPNGIIYFGPYDATYIATVNPTTNVFTLNPYSQAPPQLNSLGGVLAADGNFYFVPYYNFTSIYYFNPTTNTYSSFAITKSNTRYYGGILAPNGKIYGLAFYNISTIMCVIDPVAKTFAEFGTASTQQYAFMVYGGNGTIYAFPSGASNIGVLNTTNNTITPNVISGGTGYTSGVLGPDGKIYLFGSGTIGILNVATGNITTLPSVSGSYQRGLLTATGNIYLLPSSGTSTVGLIKFSGLSQTPLLSFCLSPYVNRQVTLY